jgi:hypothetical protein
MEQRRRLAESRPRQCHYGQKHAADPRVSLPESPRCAYPYRHAQRAEHKIQREKHTGEIGSLDDILYEEQDQRSRDRAGDAAQDEHAHQPAKLRVS